MKANFDKRTEKLNNIIEKAIKKQKYEKALQAIVACSHLYYMWNQVYIEETLEKQVETIKDVIKNRYDIFNKEEQNNNTILFYDGFRARY